MSDKLKKFVNDHKQEFESEPAKDLWSKIDLKLEIKDPARISSNWLAKFKYIWLSASILIVAIYVIANNSKNESSERSIAHQNDPVVSSALKEDELAEKAGAIAIKTNSSLKTEIDKEKKRSLERSNSNQVLVNGDLNPDTLKIRKETIRTFANSDEENITESHSDSIAESENRSAEVKAVKKTKFSIPAEPEKPNTYTGTLYNGVDFCTMLRAYKFPGKVGLDMGGYRNAENYKIKMSTISCSRLARVVTMKAVWVKGKTTKKIMFSLMDGFKSIKLVKKDGSSVTPEAISHYYPGLLVISNYNGKFFNMAFEEKVDLILFFKDAEEGDKVVIDGSIEAYVKGQQ